MVITARANWPGCPENCPTWYSPLAVIKTVGPYRLLGEVEKLKTSWYAFPCNIQLYGGNTMVRFPIGDLLDKQECYGFLMRVLHPEGLKCPNGHPLLPDQAPHDRYRAPIVDYRCCLCSCVFNICTGTIWQGTHPGCTKIALFLRGVATLQLADELGVGYETLLR